MNIPPENPSNYVSNYYKSEVIPPTPPSFMKVPIRMGEFSFIYDAPLNCTVDELLQSFSHSLKQFGCVFQNGKPLKLHDIVQPQLPVLIQVPFQQAGLTFVTEDAQTHHITVPSTSKIQDTIHGFEGYLFKLETFPPNITDQEKLFEHHQSILGMYAGDIHCNILVFFPSRRKGR